MGLKGLKALKTLNPNYIGLISKVVVGTDKAIKEDYSKDIQTVAKNLGVEYGFNKYEKLDDSETGIAIAWRWMINCEKNLFVIHDSLLPKYRGFNPLVSALINGDEEVGISIIKANAEFDEGDIVIQLGIKINYPIKIKEVIDQISDLYGKGVNMLIHQLVNSTLVEQKQNDAEASYSVWRDEDDYYINWNLNSDIIKRHIDAVGFPYLGARTKYKNQTLVIMDAIEEKELDVVNRVPGKVLKKSGNRYYVICGKGILSIKQFFTVEGDVFQPKKFRMKFE